VGTHVRYLPAAIVLAGALGLPASLNATEPITVSVWPAVAIARGAAQLKIVVERNDLNRSLMWEIDGPNYYRSSTEQIDGADSPRNWLFLLKELPAGEFDVRATVKRSNNSQALAQCRIRVVPGSRR